LKKDWEERSRHLQRKSHWYSCQLDEPLPASRKNGIRLARLKIIECQGETGGGKKTSRKSNTVVFAKILPA
jgi:hypothetical protein